MQKVLKGLYLVINPSMETSLLMKRVARALDGGVDMLQIWNHWPDDFRNTDKEQLIRSICNLASEYDIPVLINEQWRWLKNTPLDGVHFDQWPQNLSRIRKEIDREFIAGVTCTNDLEVVPRADEANVDYISFCSMFPSPSVDSCEIVHPDTVEKARKITDLPLFLSGGITPNKTKTLSELSFDGIAVISGIMKSDKPQEKTLLYKKTLNER